MKTSFAIALVISLSACGAVRPYTGPKFTTMTLPESGGCWNAAKLHTVNGVAVGGAKVAVHNDSCVVAK